MYFCRKSDPEIKGKIENVINYIKYNFLRGRVFVNIDTLNGQGMEWFSRTTNAKVHSATRKIPQEQWLVEKNYLYPFMDFFKPASVLNEHNVRKDNTISYKGNFYRLPSRTYKPPGTIVRTEKTNDNQLIIYNTGNEKIASHKFISEKEKPLEVTIIKGIFLPI